MPRCELFGDICDIEITVDYPTVPQIGSKIRLTEMDGGTILSGTVEEVVYPGWVGENGLIDGSEVALMLKLEYVDDGAIANLAAFQHGLSKQYQTNKVWRANHPEEWAEFPKNLGEEDFEKLTIAQVRQVQAGELDQSLRIWVKDQHERFFPYIDEQFFENWSEGVLTACSKLEVGIS